MKKLMMLVVSLALIAAVSIPAVAQVKNSLGNETESGDFSGKFSVQSTGNNSDQCVPMEQFGNTGNLANAQGFLQYASTADKLEGEGPTFKFAPELTAPCDQKVQQSSAASSH